jgi:hypothetical protein
MTLHLACIACDSCRLLISRSSLLLPVRVTEEDGDGDEEEAAAAAL